MNNPLRSERDAFRMVLLTIGYLGLIGIGWRIDRWLGVAVFLALTVGGVAWLLRRRPHGRRSERADERPAEELRVLVVAEDGGSGSELLQVLTGRAAGRRAVVQVVSPPSAERLAASLLAMRSVGLDATGEAVEGGPGPALEEAVRRFRPDELVVSSGPTDSRWIEPGFVDWARERFDLPVVAVAADQEGT